MSYERNKIISLIYRIFQAEDYRWFDTKNNVPSFDEIEEQIEKMECECEKTGIVETGRIQICYNKDSKTFEYYLNLGII